MKFTKSPQQLIDLFDKMSPLTAGVEPRKMFGYPALFVNGHLFSGLHGKDMILRLSELDRLKLIKIGAKIFEPMPGHKMKEYAVVPDSILKKPVALRRWIAKSLSYARTLPPKSPKRKIIKK